MTKPLVNINLIVFNGAKYIRHCLDALKKQSYSNIEVTILDNNSQDKTRQIIKQDYPELKLIEHPVNLGMWPGQELVFNQTDGKYVLALSVDVLLDPDFITKAIEIFETDKHIGAIEPKIYQYRLQDIEAGKPLEKKIIDTCGFEIYRSRRVVNVGHGEQDRGEYSVQKEIFAVEGAAPIFRRETLDNISIDGHFADPDFFWYADDLDLAWRMQIFGWKQLFCPAVIAYHDRSTTKALRKSRLEFIKIRKQIPFHKRALDFRNKILTFIKNDHIINVLKDLPFILKREVPLWGYYLIFEPSIFLEIFKIVRLTPNMLKKRREIMLKAKLSAGQIHTWFK